jgi:hypothetical protein
MLANTTLTNTFFGGTFSSSLGGGASGYFGSTGNPNRTNLINALVKNAVGVSVNPQAAGAVSTGVDALLTRVVAVKPGATVSDATQAACTAVLGSAVVSLQ